VSPDFAGCQVKVAPFKRIRPPSIQRGGPVDGYATIRRADRFGQRGPTKPFSIAAKPSGNDHRLIIIGTAPAAAIFRLKPTVQPVIGTYCYQLGYFSMISPVNIAIYAFGGFMLFALAIGFFAAPV